MGPDAYDLTCQKTTGAANPLEEGLGSGVLFSLRCDGKGLVTEVFGLLQPRRRAAGAISARPPQGSPFSFGWRRTPTPTPTASSSREHSGGARHRGVGTTAGARHCARGRRKWCTGCAWDRCLRK